MMGQQTLGLINIGVLLYNKVEFNGVANIEVHYNCHEVGI